VRELLFSLFILLFSVQVFAQGSEFLVGLDDDLAVDSGGDIFTDFSENVEEAQILEDERFYRYGRFFTFNLGFGTTGFTGNRGAAYTNNNPSYHISTTYFFDFHRAISIGVEFSKHTMFIDTPTFGFPSPPGAIEVNMLRPFLAYRYYIDTSNLGTAITYSNPYFVGRMEYWYQTNKLLSKIISPMNQVEE
jgi:hypothetical protein